MTEFRQSRKPKSSIQQIANIYWAFTSCSHLWQALCIKCLPHLRKWWLGSSNETLWNNLWSLSSLSASHVGSNSLTIKTESMPPAVEAQSFHHWTPRKVPPPTHFILLYFIIFFQTHNFYSESDRFLPHTAPNLIKGVNSHPDNCKASWLVSLLPGPSTVYS